MAKIPQGILGVVIGSLGPVTGKKWKTKLTLSSHRQPAKTDKHPTPDQQVQRSKMAVVSHFQKGTKELVKLTFREPAIDITEFQCAISYNMCNAVSGSSGAYTLHYDRAAVGRGTLPNASMPEAKAGDKTGDLVFSWIDNTGTGQAAANDSAFVVIYCPATGKWSWNRMLPVRRSDKQFVINMPHLIGKTIHTWLTFTSAAGKSADSVYTGEILVK
ncbi:MAG: hypothetical protein JST39_02400 [Bacteroidetes bacterium]|nr:hypothetical protein [Bacteroidota bacterium]